VNHKIYLSGDKDRALPNGKLTRAQAAVMIFALLEYQPERTGEASFPDVPAGAWYENQALTLAELGAFAGDNYGRFNPGHPITRREFITVLSHFFPVDEEALQAFTDVTPDMWGSAAINTAAANGWVSGVSTGVFAPNRSITRAEAVVMLNNITGRKADAAALKANTSILVFLDLEPSHWAYQQIMEASVPHIHSEDGSWADFTYPTASREPGYHLIGGELYKVDNAGHYVRNHTDGVLRFGDNGRYTTGSAELDRQLTALVKTYAKEGDTNFNNYRRLHNYVSTLPYRAGSYLGLGSQDGQTGWEADMALDMLKNRKGNCYRYAGLGTMLARKFGYQATGISGKVNIGYGFVLHGWVEIQQNGQTLICDPQQQYRFPNSSLYMKKYSELTNRKYSVKNVIKK